MSVNKITPLSDAGMIFLIPLIGSVPDGASTSVGTDLSDFEPIPSSPFAPVPQAYTIPSLPRPKYDLLV
ncbi:hypothetical protein D3C81_2291920 [compost metagenome]